MKKFIFIYALLFSCGAIAGNSVGGPQDGTAGDNTGQHRPVYNPDYGVLYLPEVDIEHEQHTVVKGVSLQHIGEYRGYQFFVLEK